MLSIIRLSLLSTSLLLASTPLLAQNDDKTAIYLENFATYFGIDVENAWSDPRDETNKKLPHTEAANMDEIIAISTALINNQTFTNPLFGQVFNDFALISKNLIDNQTEASTPTEQALQDLIATAPENHLCTDDLCILNNMQLDLLRQEMPENPYEANKALLAELNFESLLAPLSYEAESGGLSYGSPSPSSDSANNISEEEKAYNFIRYLTRQVDPLFQPAWLEYSDIRHIALDKSSDVHERASAAFQIFNYLTNQRTYAAQSSIGLSNLNDMLARRIKNTTTSEQGSSQAETEYQMATHRLYEGKWQQEMEQAAPLVLQQQMLYLLAEVNYQLYLSRTQNERILATLSAMQLQDIQERKSELFLDSSDFGDAFYDE